MECTDAGADAYTLFAAGNDGDARFAVATLLDEFDFTTPTGVCGLDLKQKLENIYCEYPHNLRPTMHNL